MSFSRSPHSLTVLVLVVASCSPLTFPFDEGSSDAGIADTGELDATPSDAAPADGGEPDAATLDGGTADSGATDAGFRDSGLLMYDLDVSLLGAASGSVLSTPSGIDCGDTCSAVFPLGATVELVATPHAHSRFTTWGGDCTGTTSRCIVTVNAALSVTAEFEVVPSVAVGSGHTCAVNNGGRVRCWGHGLAGKLGHDSEAHIGDGVGQRIQVAGDVAVGVPVGSLGLGSFHTCAVTAMRGLRCWGLNSEGQLGYDSIVDVSDGAGPTITGAGDVAIGGPVDKVVGGFHHTCALLDGGSIRCWGRNREGQLGYGHQSNVGNGSGATIIQAGDVPLGAIATDVCAGSFHTCAVTANGRVRCWGNGVEGQLGYGTTTRIGDGVGPSIIAVGSVALSSPVRSVACGDTHTCAMLTTNAVRCWGSGADGRLGYNSLANIGDLDADLSQLPDVPIGATVDSISIGSTHSCVVLSNGAVRCWGSSASGQLGHNAVTNVGDNSIRSIIMAGNVPVGTAVQTVVASHGGHTCALTALNTIRCWGDARRGRLGYNDETNVADGTGATITVAGDVPVW